MKLLVLILLIVFIMSGVCLAGIVDDNVEKVGEKLTKAVDESAEKMTTKVSSALEKGFAWLIEKLLAFIAFVVEIAAIIGVGWIISFMCDRDSRKMVRILVILCVISVVVNKLVSLTA